MGSRHRGAKGRLFPTWCHDPDRKCWSRRKPFVVHRGDKSQGAHRVLATDKGFAPHVMLTTTLGVGLNITHISQKRKLRPRGGKRLAEEVRHRAELSLRGPDCPPAPALLHEVVRTGSWGGGAAFR